MREHGHEQREIQQKRERAFWLDVLRVLLCAGVVACHYVPGSPVSGPAGVDGFFVLSGFLLAGGFERMRQKRGMNVCSFYQSKLIRLMPTLLASLLLGFLGILAKHFVSSGLLYPLWAGSDFRLPLFLNYYNAPSWYMACECAFLALAPFLYYVYNRGQTWMYVLLAAAFAFTAALYFKADFAFSITSGLYYEPQVRLWQFVAGICAWCMFGKIQLTPRKKVAAFILFALTVIILVVTTIIKDEHYWRHPFLFDAGMVLLFMVSIPASAKLPAPRDLHLSTAFAYLAALTYPVFLYHYLVWRIVCRFFGELLHVHLPNAVLILIASCATLILSALSLRYLDGYFARRRN